MYRSICIRSIKEVTEADRCIGVVESDKGANRLSEIKYILDASIYTPALVKDFSDLHIVKAKWSAAGRS